MRIYFVKDDEFLIGRLCRKQRLLSYQYFIAVYLS